MTISERFDHVMSFCYELQINRLRDNSWVLSARYGGKWKAVPVDLVGGVPSDFLDIALRAIEEQKKIDDVSP